jgi:hypothetical protein
MKISRKKQKEQRITLLHYFLITMLMLLPLVMASNVRAQEEPVDVDVTSADRVSATYGVSNFGYHVFPSKTQAGRAGLLPTIWAQQEQTSRPRPEPLRQPFLLCPLRVSTARIWFISGATF